MPAGRRHPLDIAFDDSTCAVRARFERFVLAMVPKRARTRQLFGVLLDPLSDARGIVGRALPIPCGALAKSTVERSGERPTVSASLPKVYGQEYQPKCLFVIAGLLVQNRCAKRVEEVGLGVCPFRRDRASRENSKKPCTPQTFDELLDQRLAGRCLFDPGQRFNVRCVFHQSRLKRFALLRVTRPHASTNLAYSRIQFLIDVRTFVVTPKLLWML